MKTEVFKLITNQEFIETYHPVCNTRFPTTLLQRSLLHPYVFQRDEYALIAEYVPARRFFSIIYRPASEQFSVIPGLHNELHCRGYIITECEYRPENLCYTIVEFIS